jgi:hypothetical protein
VSAAHGAALAQQHCRCTEAHVLAISECAHAGLTAVSPDVGSSPVVRRECTDCPDLRPCRRSQRGQLIRAERRLRARRGGSWSCGRPACPRSRAARSPSLKQDRERVRRRVMTSIAAVPPGGCMRHSLAAIPGQIASSAAQDADRLEVEGFRTRTGLHDEPLGLRRILRTVNSGGLAHDRPEIALICSARQARTIPPTARRTAARRARHVVYGLHSPRRGDPGSSHDYAQQSTGERPVLPQVARRGGQDPSRRAKRSSGA